MFTVRFKKWTWNGQIMSHSSLGWLNEWTAIEVLAVTRELSRRVTCHFFCPALSRSTRSRQVSCTQPS